MSSSAIVQKLWNYCNVLRDDLSACDHAQAGGMSCGDYPSVSLRAGSEQLTYLLFLFTCASNAGRKMADERTKEPYNQPSIVPEEWSWPVLVRKDGDELFDHYRHLLEELAKEKGLLALIFNKSQNKFQGRGQIFC